MSLHMQGWAGPSLCVYGIVWVSACVGLCMAESVFIWGCMWCLHVRGWVHVYMGLYVSEFACARLCRAGSVCIWDCVWYLPCAGLCVAGSSCGPVHLSVRLCVCLALLSISGSCEMQRPLGCTVRQDITWLHQWVLRATQEEGALVPLQPLTWGRWAPGPTSSTRGEMVSAVGASGRSTQGCRRVLPQA